MDTLMGRNWKSVAMLVRDKWQDMEFNLEGGSHETLKAENYGFGNAGVLLATIPY